MAFSFELTSEQEHIRDQARGFAAREIAPIAAEVDEKDVFPWHLYKKLAQPPYQYTAWFIPEEYGGRPRSLMDTCIIAEELAYAGKSTIGTVLIEACGLGTGSLKAGGNEVQKRKYWPPVARGEAVMAFGLTEPRGGSDAAGLETMAERDGDHYVLRGRKRYASFASICNQITIFARTDPGAGARGISAFIVEQGTPGFKVVEKVPCLGMRGHQDEEVVLEDCRIPKGNLIGEEGKGLRYALASLDETRTTLCGGYIGLARAALEDAVDYAKARQAFGKPLSEYQALRFPMADVSVMIEAARLMMYRVAWMADHKNAKHTAETAAAKSLASETLLKAINVAVEVLGGFGCTKRHPVERYYRDGRIWVFAQGAPNIQKLIVSRALFGE
ncbi:MAG: acyl-CoA dehydrogenase family protein [Chloroflexota bacterium]